MEIKFEEANINAVQLSVSSQNTLSASSSSLSAKPHSTNFTSSLDLINLDVMSQRSSTSISSSSNINDFGSNFDPVLGNTNKSEGKCFVRKCHVSNPRHYNASQIGILKQKRNAYSSRYALSLVDLLNSTYPVSLTASRPPLSYVSAKSQTNTNIAHIPAHKTSSLTNKCVTINPNAVFGTAH